MPKAMVCPWFKYYTKTSIICEGCRLQTVSGLGIDIWTKQFCCSDTWRDCPISKERMIDYEQKE